MKAMEKDRSRRYDTANGLGLDIGRHLAHEPVSASPPGALYRLGKLARRRKGLVAAVATITLSLLGGIMISTWQAIRAHHSAKDARESESKAIRFGNEATTNATAAQQAKADAQLAAKNLRQTLVRFRSGRSQRGLRVRRFINRIGAPRSRPPDRSQLPTRRHQARQCVDPPQFSDGGAGGLRTRAVC